MRRVRHRLLFRSLVFPILLFFLWYAILPTRRPAVDSSLEKHNDEEIGGNSGRRSPRVKKKSGKRLRQTVKEWTEALPERHVLDVGKSGVEQISLDGFEQQDLEWTLGKDASEARAFGLSGGARAEDPVTSSTVRDESAWLTSQSLGEWLSQSVSPCLSLTLVLTARDSHTVNIVNNSPSPHFSSSFSVLRDSGMFDAGLMRVLDYNYTVVKQLAQSHGIILVTEDDSGDDGGGEKKLSPFVQTLVEAEMKFAFRQYLNFFHQNNSTELLLVDRGVSLDVARDAVSTVIPRSWCDHRQAEISSVYFAHPLAHRRISSTIDDVEAVVIVLGDPWQRFLAALSDLSESMNGPDFRRYLARNLQAELTHLEQCLALEQSISDCEISDQISVKELDEIVRDKYHVSKSLYSHWLDIWMVIEKEQPKRNENEIDDEIAGIDIADIEIADIEIADIDADNDESFKKLPIDNSPINQRPQVIVLEALDWDLSSSSNSTLVQIPYSQGQSSMTLEISRPPYLEPDGTTLRGLVPADYLQRAHKIIRADRERLERVLTGLDMTGLLETMKKHWTWGAEF